MLDLTALTNAVSQLTRALGTCRTFETADAALAEQLRGGAIQAFEYTYELCVKTLRRLLEEMEGTGIDHLAFREVVRLGAERGLINDPEAWFRFRELRNLSSHSYDHTKAMTVFAALPGFADAAGSFLAAATRRNACT